MNNEECCVKREATNEEMAEYYLYDVLLHTKLGKAPIKTERIGKLVEAIVGIGNDHVAYITLTEEAYEELKARR